MKTKLTQAKYTCKKGCGCKLCKPQKGGHIDRRSPRDVKLSVGHQQQFDEQ
jgi:hypothetical protein